MEWLLEVALIGLLAATLFHALRLERALGVLKRDRAMLEGLVSSFDTSTRLAEQGIESLRKTADGAGRQLSRQIESGAAMKDDLVFLAERGEQLTDRLDKLVRAGRAVIQESAVDYKTPVFNVAAIEDAIREPAGMMPPARHKDLAGNDTQPRLRSQGERDLLKALRMAR